MVSPDPAVLRYKDQIRDPAGASVFPEVIAVPVEGGDVSVITDGNLLHEQQFMLQQQQQAAARQKELRRVEQAKKKKIQSNKPRDGQKRKQSKKKRPPVFSCRNTCLLLSTAIFLAFAAFAGTYCGLGNCGRFWANLSSSDDDGAKPANNDTNEGVTATTPPVVEFVQSMFRNSTALRYPPLVGASPEELALAWLVKHERKFPLPASAHRILQRFVLRIFYFQQIKYYGRPIQGWFDDEATILEECSWENIQCDDQRQVVQEIYLGSAGLRGTIPPALGLLTELRVVSVADNAFRGTIPAAVGRCTDLTQLALNDNVLTGTIPSSLSALSNLAEAYFHHNEFQGTMPLTAEFISADCDEVACPDCVLCCGEGEDC